MSDEHFDPSVQTWINRAKRAQRLVSQVDLERIVNHDAAEFEKLIEVSRAMDLLCNEVDKPVAPRASVGKRPLWISTSRNVPNS